MRSKIHAELKGVAEHVAAAHGATVETEIPVGTGNPVTVNDSDLTAKMLPSLRAVAGAEHVIEPPLQMGAEDFAYYAKEVPSMFFFVGAPRRGSTRRPRRATIRSEEHTSELQSLMRT